MSAVATFAVDKVRLSYRTANFSILGILLHPSPIGRWPGSHARLIVKGCEAVTWELGWGGGEVEDWGECSGQGNSSPSEF